MWVDHYGENGVWNRVIRPERAETGICGTRWVPLPGHHGDVAVLPPEVWADEHEDVTDCWWCDIGGEG